MTEQVRAISAAKLALSKYYLFFIWQQVDNIEAILQTHSRIIPLVFPG